MGDLSFTATLGISDTNRKLNKVEIMFKQMPGNMETCKKKVKEGINKRRK